MLDCEQQAREFVEVMKNHPLNSEQIKDSILDSWLECNN